MTVFNQKFPVVLCKSFAMLLKCCWSEILKEWLMGAQKGISVISPPDFYMQQELKSDYNICYISFMLVKQFHHIQSCCEAQWSLWERLFSITLQGRWWICQLSTREAAGWLYIAFALSCSFSSYILPSCPLIFLENGIINCYWPNYPGHLPMLRLVPDVLSDLCSLVIQLWNCNIT